MRDMVLQVFALSLDGIIQTDGTDFEKYFLDLPADPAQERFIVDSISNASLHAVGRTTYESMARYFPTVSHEGGANPMTTSAIDEAMNRIPKVVFSKSLKSATWGETAILSGSTLVEIDRLRREGDGYVLVHGGASLAQSLVRLDAVDVYRLTLCPYIAGEGPSLFPHAVTPRKLELMAAEPFGNGVVGLTFRRAR